MLPLGLGSQPGLAINRNQAPCCAQQPGQCALRPVVDQPMPSYLIAPDVGQVGIARFVHSSCPRWPLPLLVLGQPSVCSASWCLAYLLLWQIRSGQQDPQSTWPHCTNPVASMGFAGAGCTSSCTLVLITADLSSWPMDPASCASSASRTTHCLCLSPGALSIRTLRSSTPAISDDTRQRELPPAPSQPAGQADRDQPRPRTGNDRPRVS